MRHYEIVVLVGAEQHDRGTTMAERYRTMVADDGGAVHRFEDWGARRLAYPIGKRQRARFFLFNIECGAETLGKLKDDFRYSESVIRSLVIRRDEAIVDESPMMAEIKARAEREDAAAAEEGKAGEGNADDAGKAGKAGDTPEAKATAEKPKAEAKADKAEAPADKPKAKGKRAAAKKDAADEAAAADKSESAADAAGDDDKEDDDEKTK